MLTERLVCPTLFPHIITSFPYKAILGIAAVRDAVQRYPPTDQTLTAIHSDLIQVRYHLIYYMYMYNIMHCFLLAVFGCKMCQAMSSFP